METALCDLNKYFKSKLISRRNEVSLYTAIIRPTLIYGCEICRAVFNRSKKGDCLTLGDTILGLISGGIMIHTIYIVFVLSLINSQINNFKF